MRHERTTRRDRTDAARAGPDHTGRQRVSAHDLATTRGGGAPLDAATRGFMEARFGHSFADVRVHAGADADRSARDLRANAYTVGSDIAFRSDHYAPGTLDGLALLGHELAHVVQQDGAALPADGTLDVSRPTDAAEMSAHAAGVQAVAGQSVGGAVTTGGGAASVQREEEHESSFWGDLVGAGASIASMIPGVGLLAEPLAATHGIAEGVEGGAEGDTMKSILGFGHGVAGIGGLAAEYGGFEMLGWEGLSAAGEALSSGGVGGLFEALGTVGGLGAEAGATLPAASVFGGAGLEGAAALGPGAAVLGAGLAGAGVGHLLYNHTSVGEHSVGALGTIDGWLTGDGEESWIQRTADAAGNDWDNGDYLGAIGNGLELGGVGLAGAIGGIGGGIVDGIGAIGSGIADLFD